MHREDKRKTVLLAAFLLLVSVFALIPFVDHSPSYFEARKKLGYAFAVANGMEKEALLSENRMPMEMLGSHVTCPICKRAFIWHTQTTTGDPILLKESEQSAEKKRFSRMEEDGFSSMMETSSFLKRQM